MTRCSNSDLYRLVLCCSADESFSGLLIGSVAYLEGLGLVPNMNYGRCVHVCEGAVICLCLVEHRGDELTQTSADKLLIKFPLYQVHMSPPLILCIINARFSAVSFDGPSCSDI